MRSAALTTGRRFLVVLDPGEDLLETVSSWAVAHGVTSATIDMFFGAFRRVGLIAADGPIEDPEAPLPASVDVTYLEGVGAGSISTVDGIPRAHLHVAAGVKAEAGAAYAGHVLYAETHYTVELVVQEILAPTFAPRLSPEFGIPCMHFSG
ncbi:MAG: DNA-binding protein [Microbacterium sp.]|uniref:PPC domain-containing DNA-binding protein n=1 Tax=Microbacterium sp. TaxID=51671 RepID=UPI00261F24B2|nr:PPC domain-containing DNA-binding protein [Microbacterium sp.]MCX6502848.1 DNA-binding protein [Microbacterium sp.]